MGHIRDISKMMEESRARKAREREKKKQERIKQYKALCKQADQLLKQAQEQEKRKKMEQLQALADKASQSQNKQHLKPSFTVSRLPIYNTNLVERNPGERDLYTLEELKNIETLYPNEFGRINWDVWNRLVEEGRKQDEEFLKNYVPPVKQRHDNRRYTVYVYNNHLDFLGEYPSTTQAGKAFGLHSRSVSYWIEQGKPHKKLGITFLTHKITEY